MTAAYRLKGLGWFGGVVLVSLSFYLVSSQVAAERKRLAQVDVKISAAERDIRALETEFDVRSNLVQLERWNGDTLALVAPTAQQFVRDEAQLAAISFTPGSPAAAFAGDNVRTAQLIVPSRPAAPTPTVIDEVSSRSEASLVQVADRPAAPRPARVQVITEVTQSAHPTMIKAVSLTTGEPSAVIRKARAVAMLDKTLLSDRTLGDLLSGARSEKSSLR